MTTRFEIQRLRAAPPAAVVNMYPGHDYGGPFVVLELRTGDTAVAFFLNGECAAWAQSVAAAINTPVAAEVAA